MLLHKSIVENLKLDYYVLQKHLLILMLMYFAINPFSFHYFVWLSPFITIYLGMRPALIKYSILLPLFWFIMGIFGTDRGVFSQNLFLPLSESLYWLPIVPEYLDKTNIFGQFNSSTITMLARGALTGTLLYMVYLVSTEKKRNIYE